MTIIAKRSVQLNGHIYAKGESAEWNGRIDSRIAELFTAKDGTRLIEGMNEEPKGPKDPKGPPGEPGMTVGEQQPTQPPAGEQTPPQPPSGTENKDADDATTTADRIQKLVATLGRKGIEQKLDELKVSFSSNAKTETLAKLLLQQQGEIDA